MSEDLSQERKILLMMRKTLAQVIKDTTPEFRTMHHPLSERTIQDIRDCFALIAARERELADEAGIAEERPHFRDEKPSAVVVPLHGLSKKTSE